MVSKRKIRRKLNLKRLVLLLTILVIAIPVILGACTLFSGLFDGLKGIASAIFKFSYELAYLIF